MKTHTIAEVNELKAWFDAQQLPTTLQLNQSTFIPDVATTVESLFMQAYICYENPKMQGCIVLLQQIKKVLEK